MLADFGFPPDICARLTRTVARINFLQGAGVFRVNDLVKTVKKWQPATELKYFSSCTQGRGSLDPRIKDERHRKGAIHGNAMTLVGLSDAALGDQFSMGKCRLGYVIGIMSSNLCGPCHLVQWTSKLTRKLVKSSLGGEVYAFSETLDPMSMLRGFYGLFTDLFSGMVDLDDCEILFTHLKKNKPFSEKFLVRHFSAIPKAVEIQELDNVYWAPVEEHPADGPTTLHSEILPLLRLVEAGTYKPGCLRPLKGAAFWEQ